MVVDFLSLCAGGFGCLSPAREQTVVYICGVSFFFSSFSIAVSWGFFFFFFSIFVSQVFVFGVLQAFAMYFKRLVFFLLKKLQNSVLNVVVEYNFSIFNCESGRFLDDFFFFFHMWHHSLNCREKTSAFIYNI